MPSRLIPSPDSAWMCPVSYTHLFHNAKEQIARGAGPFFYLPKMESHLEARLLNDIFAVSYTHLDV